LPSELVHPPTVPGNPNANSKRQSAAATSITLSGSGKLSPGQTPQRSPGQTLPSDRVAVANSPATALSSCEVWGVHPAAQQQRRKLAAQHRGYVRSICRLPTGVPTEALMAELGRTDIEAWWLAHSLRFWNSLCAQPRGSLHYELLIDAQSEALLVALGTGCGGCGEGAKGWGMSCRSARSERGASTCNMCLACGQRSSSGHGRPSACALGHAGPRVQLSARTLSFPARRGSRCTCGFSGSGTRRGASAAIYVSNWLQHTASGDGQAGPHAQAPAALPAVRPRGGGRRAAHDC